MSTVTAVPRSRYCDNPDAIRALVAPDSRSSAAEAYRILRTSVLLSSAGKPPKTILVTSGQPGEGKTTTAVNTAISLSQLGEPSRTPLPLFPDRRP